MVLQDVGGNRTTEIIFTQEKSKNIQLTWLGQGKGVALL